MTVRFIVPEVSIPALTSAIASAALPARSAHDRGWSVPVLPATSCGLSGDHLGPFIEISGDHFAESPVSNSKSHGNSGRLSIRGKYPHRCLSFLITLRG